MRKAASQTERIKDSIILALIVTLFVSIFFMVVRSAYAWSTSQSAQSYCDTSAGKVKIKVTFKNTEPSNSNLGMYVVARDEQTNATVTLGAIAPQQTKEGTIETNRTSISNGRVRFDLTWTNGQSGSDVRYASYTAAQCQVATPTPTATPVVTPTATPVVTPTATPVVTPTATPTSTPVVTASPTPVVTPTATPVVTPTATPVVTPTPSSTPRTDISDNRSDGSKDALDCVPESKNGRKSCNPVVAGVSTTLPSTGIMDDQVTVYAIAAVMSFLLGMVVFQYVKIEERSLRQ